MMTQNSRWLFDPVRALDLKRQHGKNVAVHLVLVGNVGVDLVEYCSFADSLFFFSINS